MQLVLFAIHMIFSTKNSDYLNKARKYRQITG